MKTTLFLLVPLLLAASPASAAIFGSIEAPDQIGSQVANIQGWVYTTTPGAELIQPFLVRINGEDAFMMPCCGDRGDVRDARPDAPLDTGFSAVHNFARTAQRTETAVIEVIVTDSTGDSLTLSKTVEVFALNLDIQFFRELVFDQPDPSLNGARQGWCGLGNDGALTEGTVDLVCHNLVAKGVSAAGTCDQVRYSWDRGSQGLKQTSDCVPESRWVENGDGTATDNWTGLIWELKTDDGIHSVTSSFEWSSPGGTLPNGPLFGGFLGTLNGAAGEGCFAERCDWRLPTAVELQGIIAPSPDCDGSFSVESRCTTIPGLTRGDYYFTSETSANVDFKARAVDFASGGIASLRKTTITSFVEVRGAWHARAVRRPSPWE